jgi:predicted dehydrogenase
MSRAVSGGRLNIHKVPSQPVLRAAVIGGGVFGRHHAAKYRDIAGIELVAVADPDPLARKQVADRLQVPAVADWHQLLGKLDLVSICSPAVTHAEIARAFLDCGAHVLVEKPIATSISDADYLIALARSRGLVLTVGHQERYVISQTGLFEIPQSPAVVECVRRGPWTGRGADVSVVLDLMIHDLDLVHALIPGEISDVQADGRFVYGPSHDHVRAELVFDSGATVRLIADRAAKVRTRSLRLIYPDGGEISVDFMSREIANTTANHLKLRDSSDPLGDSISGFVEAVRAGAAVLVRPEEALRALETALRVEDAMVPAVVSRKRQAVRRTA